MPFRAIVFCLGVGEFIVRRLGGLFRWFGYALGLGLLEEAVGGVVGVGGGGVVGVGG